MLNCPLGFFLSDALANVFFIIVDWYAILGVQSPLNFPAREVISSGGCYLVSFPSIDDFSRRRRNANRPLLVKHTSTNVLDTHHLSVIVFGASGDLAKRKT